METPSMPWDALFARHQRRGGGRIGTPTKPKDGSAGEAAGEELVPDEPGPEAQAAEADKPKARLFNPAWGSEQGYFNEKVVATVEGELPPESSHLTRITFTLQAVKDGQAETVGTKEAHLEGGKASAEFDLWIPQFRDEAGNLVQECEYVFTAKHRDSPEIESPALLGRPRSNGLPPDAVTAVTTIEVVLLQEGNRPRAEEKYVLTDAAGTVFQGVTDKDGRVRVEDAAPGEATIAFPGLEQLAAATTRVAAGAAGDSSFYLRIQMDPEAAKQLEEKFILASEDGAFTQTRTADDDLILGDNFIDLRFTGLPIDKAYTLTIEGKGKPPYAVFKNVPFLKLDGFVEQGEA
jgi:hypothetical protein